jgi:hypothetical protein
MRFDWLAATAFMLALPVSAFADAVTDFALRFTCDNRASKAVIAVGALDVIKDVVDTKNLRVVIDLGSLPRNKEVSLCRLGSATISIVPSISDEHPRDDNAYVLINGVQVERTFWNLGEYGVVTVVLDHNGPAGLSVQVCRTHNNRQSSLDKRSPCALLDRP